ncbi:hypothetical protein K492DRAFT_176464 [Lichtheimia hyalospora FSU 10163]|nr:hypothetical protein K492DRAFT_176464 [Lichtheimia hyalospora FSU 10163]
MCLLRPLMISNNNSADDIWRSWMQHHNTSNLPSRDQPFDLKHHQRYVSFLPHSGLQNQRIALINAAVIAKALNRTLLLPELNLGKATYWRPSHDLEHLVANCPSNNSISTKCSEYRRYVPMPVDSIFDLGPFHKLGIDSIQRNDMHTENLEKQFGIKTIYRIHDPSRYSYQILDRNNASATQQFASRLLLEDIIDRPEQLILFGSLFGSNRLGLGDSELKDARQYLRHEMGLSHPDVLKQTNVILSQLGATPERNDVNEQQVSIADGSFTSVHMRQGDGVFRKQASNTRTAIRRALEHSHDDDKNQHETDQFMEETVERLQGLSNRKDILEACVELQSMEHLHARLRLIYMATDARSPQAQLADLYAEFVCLFTLHDFPEVTQAIADTLLLPLVDAEVASHADYFIPTPKSTFSGYISQRNHKLHSTETTLASSSSSFPSSL